ncbi:hypothetical protein [Roseateles sp.]|uniref:hypothetical protein n=1 Tax=Roseateles sp. TaxID=1971397 RepID=UPI0031D555D7
MRSERSPHRPVITAALALCLAGWTARIVSVLYHHHQSLAVILALAALSLLVCGWIAAALSRLPGAWGRLTAPALLGLALGWACGEAYLPDTFPTAVSLAPALGAAVLFLIVAARSPALLSRLAYAVAAGSLLFAATPTAMAWLLARDQGLTVAPPALSGATPTATLIVLLDELPATPARRIATALQQRGFSVAALEVPSVGRNTEEVLPSIFSGRSMKDGVPCGQHTVCTDRAAFAFDQLALDGMPLDIVGFYHPYCAIRGLRYCAMLDFSDGWERWLCRAKIRMAPEHFRRECQQQAAQDWMTLLADVDERAAAAPFWNDGGAMFLHLPLPHPPSATAGDPMPKQFTDNLALATQRVVGMAERLHQRFGNGFRLVIFSDHPLRTTLWCQNLVFAGTDCQHLPQELLDPRVPLMVVTTRPAPALGARLNADVLEYIGRRHP